MLRSSLPVAVFVVLSSTLPAAVVEARTVIKMATLVPDGSVWDQALEEMGGVWKEATGGEVELRIYPGGVAGDEPDVVRKMRIGQIQAGALTVAGLSEIDRGFEIFEVPMFFESYDELHHVLGELRPELERRLDAKGFVLLAWGHGGWVHFFSREPIRVPADLEKQKIFTWSGNEAMVQLWRRNGYESVALAATDILTGLQTGMIDALPTTPLAALSLQWYRQTPYMQDLGLAPLVGATVVTKSAWNRISEAHRTALRNEAEKLEERLRREIPEQDRRAVEAMKERGLEVVEATPEAVAHWEAMAERFSKVKEEQLEEPALLERARSVRDAYRARGKQSTGGP